MRKGTKALVFNPFSHGRHPSLITVGAKISIVTDSQSLCDIDGTQREFTILGSQSICWCLLKDLFFQSSHSEKDCYSLIITLYRKKISFLMAYFFDLQTLWLLHFGCDPVFSCSFGTSGIKAPNYLFVINGETQLLHCFGKVIPFHHGKCCALVAPLVNT